MSLTKRQRQAFDAYKNFPLSVGNHSAPVDSPNQACVMELAAHIAGEEWSDKPECVCPALAAFCRKMNDDAPQWVRDELRDRIPKLVGSKAGKSVAIKRAESFAWFAIRVAAPIALRACGLEEHADKLRDFTGSLESAARAAYAAADAAAYAAAYAAARAADAAAARAAYAAAYAAARAAARAAAYAAADAAARAADAAARAAARAADAAAKSTWQTCLDALDTALRIKK